MTNFIYSQTKPNEQNIRFLGIARVFFLESTLSFGNFKWNFDFLFEVLLNFRSPMAFVDSLTKNKVNFAMIITWTYLVLWVDS